METQGSYNPEGGGSYVKYRGKVKGILLASWLRTKYWVIGPGWLAGFKLCITLPCPKLFGNSIFSQLLQHRKASPLTSTVRLEWSRGVCIARLYAHTHNAHTQASLAQAQSERSRLLAQMRQLLSGPAAGTGTGAGAFLPSYAADSGTGRGDTPDGADGMRVAAANAAAAEQLEKLRAEVCVCVHWASSHGDQMGAMCMASQCVCVCSCVCVPKIDTAVEGMCRSM